MISKVVKPPLAVSAAPDVEVELLMTVPLLPVPVEVDTLLLFHVFSGCNKTVHGRIKITVMGINAYKFRLRRKQV